MNGGDMFLKVFSFLAINFLLIGVSSEIISVDENAIESSEDENRTEETLAVEDNEFVNITNGKSFASCSSGLPSSCAEAVTYGSQSGIYQLEVPGSGLGPFYAYCQHDPDNGPAWTVIQRRTERVIDFLRDWQEYKLGFGHLQTDFFIGLEKLYALTNSRLHELWVQLEDWEGVKRYAKYATFAIANEQSQYALIVLGGYSGTAGDTLGYHRGNKFTTKDVDNDLMPDGNCAQLYLGGWWYHNCLHCDLNGYYYNQGEVTPWGKGIIWNNFHNLGYSLKYAQMAIRPVK